MNSVDPPGCPFLFPGLNRVAELEVFDADFVMPQDGDLERVQFGTISCDSSLFGQYFSIFGTGFPRLYKGICFCSSEHIVVWKGFCAGKLLEHLFTICQAISCIKTQQDRLRCEKFFTRVLFAGGKTHPRSPSPILPALPQAIALLMFAAIHLLFFTSPSQFC